MQRNQFLVVAGAVLAVIVAVVVLLVTGGDDSVKTPPEKTGDIEAVPGGDAPDQTEIADIEFAEVRKEGETFVFEARLGAPIPKRMRGQSFDLRWDIEANDPGKFILSANLDVGANVALVGATTNNNFGSSTLDDSFPGKFEIQGNTWTITINADKVPNWPEEFTWKLSTSLDGSPGDPKSGRAEDHAPDIGFAQVVES